MAGVTVGTSTTETATQFPFQRKAFYAAGRYWAFYSDGTNFVYRTSADGVNWSAATSIWACVGGGNSSVFFDGTYVHYALFSFKEELIDPSFNDAGEWTGTDWTITGGTAQKASGTGTDTLSEVHPFTVTAGTTYLVTLVIQNLGLGSVYVTLGGATSPTYTTTGTKTFYLDTVNTDSLGIVGTIPSGYPGSPIVLGSISVKGSNLLYRRGTPNSDGTMTWSAAQQTVPFGQFGDAPMIAVDSGGCAWIGCIGAVAGYPVLYSPYVFKNANNDGTWSTAENFPYPLAEGTTGTAWAVSVTPLTGGKVYVIFGKTYPSSVFGRLWDGSAWGDEEYVGHTRNTETSSSIADGDDVHFVSVDSSSQNILHYKRTYGVGWGEPSSLFVGGGVYTGTVLSIDTATGDLYCFWVGVPDIVTLYEDIDWSGESAQFSGEVPDLGEWASRASSLMTIGNVTLYEDVDYGGESITLTGEISDLGSLGWDDRAKSLKMIGGQISNHIYYKKCASGTWDTDPTDWLDETADTFLTNDTLTCFYQTYSRRVGLLYTTKTSSPFNVKLASLGWTGKINGVTDPAKINGLSTMRIAKVMGV